MHLAHGIGAASGEGASGSGVGSGHDQQTALNYGDFERGGTLSESYAIGVSCARPRASPVDGMS